MNCKMIFSLEHWTEFSVQSAPLIIKIDLVNDLFQTMEKKPFYKPQQNECKIVNN